MVITNFGGGLSNRDLSNIASVVPQKEVIRTHQRFSVGTTASYTLTIVRPILNVEKCFLIYSDVLQYPYQNKSYDGSMSDNLTRFFSSFILYPFNIVDSTHITFNVKRTFSSGVGDNDWDFYFNKGYYDFIEFY